jgi:hypothetical protein
MHNEENAGAHNHTVRGKTANTKNLTGSNSTYNVTKVQLLLADLVTTA